VLNPTETLLSEAAITLEPVLGADGYVLHPSALPIDGHVEAALLSDTSYNTFLPWLASTAIVGPNVIVSNQSAKMTDAHVDRKLLCAQVYHAALQPELQAKHVRQLNLFQVCFLYGQDDVLVDIRDHVGSRC
jgi:hypothetical protein